MLSDTATPFHCFEDESIIAALGSDECEKLESQLQILKSSLDRPARHFSKESLRLSLARQYLPARTLANDCSDDSLSKQSL
mmetsp:Transcript_1676/g.5061  ORF Transcript_1676/g.5061 Transcript_1676/m.5061 type:complete len:81 (+) Transcript_1676:782-1024(+)